MIISISKEFSREEALNIYNESQKIQSLKTGSSFEDIFDIQDIILIQSGKFCGEKVIFKSHSTLFIIGLILDNNNINKWFDEYKKPIFSSLLYELKRDAKLVEQFCSVNKEIRDWYDLIKV
jgi:hypothetical protein